MTDWKMEKRKAALLAAAVIMGGVSVQAANEPPVFDLAEVVVTATKLKEAPEKVPASVSVVTAKEIEKRNYTSVAQAMGQLPGIYLNPVAEGGISLRGFGSADILVMVDGQPVNSGWNGSVDWSMIPVESIDKIELVRGAASSLYGSRAVGGVIQITTKTGKEGLHGKVVLAKGSYDKTKQVYDASFKKDNWEVGAGYEKRKSDGWRGYYIEERVAKKIELSPQIEMDLPKSARNRYIVGGRGAKATDAESTRFKLAYHINDNQSLTYSYFHSNYQYVYKNPFSVIRDKDGKEIFYGAVILPDGKGFDFTPKDFLGYVGAKEWSVHNLAYDDDKNQFHARIGLTDIRKDGYSSAGGPKNPITAKELEAWNGKGTQSFYPSKTKDFDMHKVWTLGNHNLLAGMAYRSESFNQTKYTLTNWRNHGSKKKPSELHGGKDESWSGYLQDKWQADEKTSVYTGVRFDRYKKYGGYGDYLLKNSRISRTYDEGTYTEWSPKFSVEHSLRPDLIIYAGYGHSFTPPILYRVYRDAASEIGSENGKMVVKKKGYIANPDLRPETTDTYEIGLKKKWGEKSSGSIAFYKAKTTDAVESFSTDEETVMNGITYKKGFSQYRNSGEASKKGVEVEFKHKFTPYVSSYVNWAWESEKINGEGNYKIPKHLLHFGVEYDKERWNILADAQYVSARQSPNDETGKYYSEDLFFITNLSANYRITPEASVQVSVYNLFDREFFAQEAASGRTYDVSFRYRF